MRGWNGGWDDQLLADIVQCTTAHLERNTSDRSKILRPGGLRNYITLNTRK